MATIRLSTRAGGRCILRILVLLSLAPLLATPPIKAATAATLSCATPYFQCQVVGKVGQAGLTGLGREVSINDGGKVAFVGMVAEGQALFVADGTAAPSNITSGPTHSTRSFAPNVHINNQDQVLAREEDVETGRDLLRIWNGDSPDTIVKEVAQGGGPGDPLVTVARDASMNNTAQVVYSAQRFSAPELRLAAGVRTIIEPVYPMIADDGQVVIRAGANDAAVVQIYDASLQRGQDIATKEMGFTRLGRRPGISDDGSTVAFYGDLSAEGAARLGAAPGPGVFAAVRLKSVWIVQRVAGIGGNDPFSAFDLDARVSVNDLRTVTYMASDTGGDKGIYTSRLNFFPVVVGGRTTYVDRVPPRKVIAQGDQITTLGTVRDVAISDSLNDADDIAFWVRTTQGEAVLRATRQCVDADYGNPATTTYINQYDAGSRLGLPATPTGIRGGNACGPSALTMLLNTLNRMSGRAERVDLAEAYRRSMQFLAFDGVDNRFLWRAGLAYVHTKGFKSARLVSGGRKELDDLLDRGVPVVVGTALGLEPNFQPGGGHVVLFLGRTAKGDYVVQDPAGNYSGRDGHYGRGSCGDYRIYSAKMFDAHPDLFKLAGGRMLAVPPQYP